MRSSLSDSILSSEPVQRKMRLDLPVLAVREKRLHSPKKSSRMSCSDEALCFLNMQMITAIHRK